MAQDHFQTTPDPQNGHGRTKNPKRIQNRDFPLKRPEPIIFFIESMVFDRKDLETDSKDVDLDTKIIKHKLINYYQQIGINMVFPGNFEELIQEDVILIIKNHRTRTALLKNF